MEEMQETWVQSLGWKIPCVGNGNTLQYSCLGNPMDRGAWWATVHVVMKSQTWLSDWACTHTHTHTHTHTPPVACGSDAQWWCPEHWVDNTEQWSLGKHSRIPEATGYNIFINQSIRNLFRDTLLNTYCTFINTELTANSTVTSAWM